MAEAAAIRHRTVEANGISMHVAESGAEGDPAVVFLHGFPELWYSWRHQMAHLAARGYRCVAPDLRGYGGTAAPPDVASYSAFHVVGDVVALLDALGIKKVRPVRPSVSKCAFRSFHFHEFLIRNRPGDVPAQKSGPQF